MNLKDLYGPANNTLPSSEQNQLGKNDYDWPFNRPVPLDSDTPNEDGTIEAAGPAFGITPSRILMLKRASTVSTDGWETVATLPENGSVLLRHLSAEVVAALSGGLDPAEFRGNITALSQDLITPVGNAGNWYFVDGVNGSMTGANPPADAVEDGGFVFSDGATWKTRAAAPVNIPEGFVTRAMVEPGFEGELPKEWNALDEFMFAWIDPDLRTVGYVKAQDGTWVLRKIESDSITSLLAEITEVRAETLKLSGEETLKRQNENDQQILVISDAAGKAVLWVKKADGTVVIPKLESPEIQTQLDSFAATLAAAPATQNGEDLYHAAFVFEDVNGNDRVTAWIDADGIFHAPRLETPEYVKKAELGAIPEIEALETTESINKKERVALQALSSMDDYEARLDEWAKLPVEGAKYQMKATGGPVELVQRCLHLPNAHTREAQNSSIPKMVCVFIDDDGIDGYNGWALGANAANDWEDWTLGTPSSRAGDPYVGAYFSHAAAVFANHGVPAVEAVIARPTFGLGAQQILHQNLHLQKYYGWELASHSVNHFHAGSHNQIQYGGGGPDAANYDATMQAEMASWGIPFDPLVYNPLYEWGVSFWRMRQWGMNVRHAVYPYGQNTHAMRKILRQFYKSGVSVGGFRKPGYPVGANVQPLSMFTLGRYGLDATGNVSVDAAGVSAYGSGAAIPIAYSRSGAEVDQYRILPHDRRDGLLQTWKDHFDSCKAVADSGEPVVLIFMTHFYNMCWRNFDTTGIDRTHATNADYYPDDWTLAGGSAGAAQLVSNGGTYPDEWVRTGDLISQNNLPSNWEPMENTRLRDLWEFIGYIKAAGVEITTLDKAINTFKPSIDIGDFTRGRITNEEIASEANANHPHHVVGIDDSASYQPLT